MNVPPNYKHHQNKTVKFKTHHVPGGSLFFGVLMCQVKSFSFGGFAILGLGCSMFGKVKQYAPKWWRKMVMNPMEEI